MVDAVSELNDLQQRAVDDPEIATRISQYEMAFRMQSSVPELMDFRDEPRHVLDIYGTKGARRLVRRQLPAGPAAGRARRALHPALSPRLGPSRRPEGQIVGIGRGSRSAAPRRSSAI